MPLNLPTIAKQGNFWSKSIIFGHHSQKKVDILKGLFTLREQNSYVNTRWIDMVSSLQCQVETPKNLSYLLKFLMFVKFFRNYFAIFGVIDGNILFGFHVLLKVDFLLLFSLRKICWCYDGFQYTYHQKYFCSIFFLQNHSGGTPITPTITHGSI